MNLIHKLLYNYNELLKAYKELKEENEVLRAQNQELHFALTYIKRRK